MKKKILVFLVFAGFLLAGGLKVNSVEAINETGKCGTAAGDIYSAEATGFDGTACADGYAPVLNEVGVSGFYFPAVGLPANWQCQKNNDISSCNARREYYTCSGSLPAGATRCNEAFPGGDDENYIISPTEWIKRTDKNGCSGSRKCEYFMPATPINYCGTNEKVYTNEDSWPAGGEFCNTKQFFIVDGNEPNFPTSTKPAVWKCKSQFNIVTLPPVTCTATKSGTTPPSASAICQENSDIRDLNNTTSCSDNEPATNRKKALSNNCPTGGSTKCNYECLKGYHLAVEKISINNVERDVSFCEKDVDNPVGCGDNEHLENNNCVSNTKVAACVPASLKGGEEWNKDSSSSLGNGQCTLTWDNGSWSSPKDKTYNETPGECNFKCDDTHNWNGNACVSNTSGGANSSASVSLALDGNNPNIENGELKAGLPFYIYYNITGSVSSCKLYRGVNLYGNLSITTGGHSKLVYTGTTTADLAQTITYQIKCDNDAVNSEVLSINVVENNDYEVVTAKINLPIETNTNIKVGGSVEFSGEMESRAGEDANTQYLWSSSCGSGFEYSQNKEFTYQATSAGIKNFYFRVKKDANSAWSACEHRQVTVTGFTCTGDFPSQEDVSAGKYAYCNPNICGPYCGLTRDIPGKKVANKAACSGAKCEYYVTSTSNLCGPAGSKDKTISSSNPNYIYSWDAKNYRGAFCLYGNPDETPDFPKMGDEESWVCKDTTGANSQTCYAKRNSNTLLVCAEDAPTHANICPDDGIGLKESTTRSLVETCSAPTGPKCEYTCITGWHKEGDVCVVNANNDYTCTNPPTNAVLCSGDQDGLKDNTPAKLVSTCDNPNTIKCQYICDPSGNYMISGGKCIKSNPFSDEDEEETSGKAQLKGRVKYDEDGDGIGDGYVKENFGTENSSCSGITLSLGISGGDNGIRVQKNGQLYGLPIRYCDNNGPYFRQEIDVDNWQVSMSAPDGWEVTSTNPLSITREMLIDGNEEIVFRIKKVNSGEETNPCGPAPSPYAHLCTGDDQGLGNDSYQAYLFPSCTDKRKCEYVCKAGYTFKESDDPRIPENRSCVPASESENNSQEESNFQTFLSMLRDLLERFGF